MFVPVLRTMSLVTCKKLYLKLKSCYFQYTPLVCFIFQYLLFDQWGFFSFWFMNSQQWEVNGSVNKLMFHFLLLFFYLIFIAAHRIVFDLVSGAATYKDTSQKCCIISLPIPKRH